MGRTRATARDLRSGHVRDPDSAGLPAGHAHRTSRDAYKERFPMQHLDDLLAPARNFLHLEAADADFDSARVVVVPVPFDGTTCYRPGAREGPQAIVDASRNLELYDAELRRSPHTVGIHTLRPVEIVNGNAEEMVDRVDRVTGHLLEARKWVLTLGGDHLVAIGAIRAHARRFPGMSVLQFDAHADLREEYEGARYSAATVMRRTLDVCPSIVQVGIRSLSAPEAQLVEERHIPQLLAADIHAQVAAGRRDWMDRTLAALGDDVYVTFDVDCFDPSLVPGTGTPEPGGLGWYDAINLLGEVAAQKRIVGADVVELSPLLEGHVSPVVAAKLAFKLIGLATADHLPRRPVG
jgi:agmatinase